VSGRRGARLRPESAPLPEMLQPGGLSGGAQAHPGAGLGLAEQVLERRGPSPTRNAGGRAGVSLRSLGIARRKEFQMHDIAKAEVVEEAAGVVLATLSSMEFETMTDGGVEFVLCASALTAQM